MGSNSPSYVRLEVEEGFSMANVLRKLLHGSAAQNGSGQILNLLGWWLRSCGTTFGFAMVMDDWRCDSWKAVQFRVWCRGLKAAQNSHQ